jgi:hypothetical protein
VLSGGIVELLMPPDLVPVASAPTPDAAKMLADAPANSPANNRGVILMFIRVSIKNEPLPDIGVRAGGLVPGG